ncbi:MAG: peptide deformylase [Candidatus Omnitrophica bacterium]|nr:peptide deformylase [Candidatus Omnitrophota bacterium]
MIATDKNFLHQISIETTRKEVDGLGLVFKLREANKTAWTKGCGLAAIQIGMPLRFAWYLLEGKEGQLLNPVIINKWGEDIAQEGCLSIPCNYTSVKRAYEIEYLTNGKKKRARGLLARLIQHEIDHMDGILIIDKRAD